MGKVDLLRVIFISWTLLALLGCGQSNTVKLTITGSSTIAPLVMELGRAFEKQQPGVRIDVQTGGSSRGIADIRAGISNIGMVSRNLKISEKDLFPHTIAYDGITLILNKSNPVSVLTDEQIIEIFRGNIRNWDEVGGPNQSITVINKAEGRSTLELFLNYFKLENRAIKADVVIGDNQQGIKTVVGNPWAIGYVSVGAAEYEEKHGSAIKLLGVGGENASIAAVKQGHYPLSRPLNIVTVNKPEGLTKAFINFAQSSKASAFVEDQYFIPINAH
mgnify:CR=1 FL=1